MDKENHYNIWEDKFVGWCLWASFVSLIMLGGILAVNNTYHYPVKISSHK